MFDAFEKLRRKVIPNSEDQMVNQLMRDVGNFEVQGWLDWLIDELVQDVIHNGPEGHSRLPENTLETWRTIGAFKQELAFCYLLGAVRGLMLPPDGFYGAKLVDEPLGGGPGERLSPPDPPGYTSGEVESTLHAIS